jgi:hypothetical protein
LLSAAVGETYASRILKAREPTEAANSDWNINNKFPANKQSKKKKR